MQKGHSRIKSGIKIHRIKFGQTKICLHLRWWGPSSVSVKRSQWNKSGIKISRIKIGGIKSGEYS